MARYAPGFLSSLFFWKGIFFDRRTPLLAKALIVFGALYGISPLDFVPDFLPLLGQLDDLGVIVVAIMMFARMTRSVQADHCKRDAYETTAKERS
jgi:uncharacterized membrane protein YkvA (DUF1232 family)